MKNTYIRGLRSVVVLALTMVFCLVVLPGCGEKAEEEPVVYAQSAAPAAPETPPVTSGDDSAAPSESTPSEG